MWRVHSLFGQSGSPDHHPSLHTDTHDALPDRIRMIGNHVGHTFWGEATVLCRVCHAELQAHEFHDGCCVDKDSCAWRALSERCCW